MKLYWCVQFDLFKTVNKNKDSMLTVKVDSLVRIAKISSIWSLLPPLYLQTHFWNICCESTERGDNARHWHFALLLARLDGSDIVDNFAICWRIRFVSPNKISRCRHRPTDHNQPDVTHTKFTLTFECEFSFVRLFFYSGDANESIFARRTTEAGNIFSFAKRTVHSVYYIHLP